MELWQGFHAMFDCDSHFTWAISGQNIYVAELSSRVSISFSINDFWLSAFFGCPMSESKSIFNMKKRAKNHGRDEIISLAKLHWYSARKIINSSTNKQKIGCVCRTCDKNYTEMDSVLGIPFKRCDHGEYFKKWNSVRIFKFVAKFF